jgi:hypothetical protein
MLGLKLSKRKGLLMSYFINVEGLYDLEEKERWEEARLLLLNIWKEDKLNSKKLIRLLAECWYVLSLWDCCIKTEDLSFQVFQETLIECTEFGLKNLKNNSQFLCVAGHMISIFPYLFYIDDADGLYTEWEQRGIDMLCRAYEIDPDDKIIEVFNLGCASDLYNEYNKAKNLLLSRLESLFPGKTELEIYFKNTLSIH